MTFSKYLNVFNINITMVLSFITKTNCCWQTAWTHYLSIIYLGFWKESFRNITKVFIINYKNKIVAGKQLERYIYLFGFLKWVIQKHCKSIFILNYKNKSVSDKQLDAAHCSNILVLSRNYSLNIVWKICWIFRFLFFYSQ